MTIPLLGQLLLDRSIITPNQLNEALKKQKHEGGLIGIILLDLGYINKKILSKYLQKQMEEMKK